MERFKLMVSLFLAQNHGRKLSDIFGVHFDDGKTNNTVDMESYISFEDKI